MSSIISFSYINDMARAIANMTNESGCRDRAAAPRLLLLSNSSSNNTNRTMSGVLGRTVSNILHFIEKNRTLVELVATGIALFYLHNQLSGSLSRVDKRLALSVKKLLAKKLNRPELEFIELNAYELKLAEEVVGADDIESGFEDVGGLKDEIENVRDNIILPFQMYKSFINDPEMHTPCPSGLLLYGKPGTGKTMIAKALAKSCNATFMPIKVSNIFEKWLGESDKNAEAIFSLARKLAPTVIFIDEVDALLTKRDRQTSSTSAHTEIFGLLLQLWDGLLNSSTDAPVLVMGATNRPNDIDEAFMRRMPVKIHIKLPDADARFEILTKVLSKEKVDQDVNLKEMGRVLEGFSGAHLKEYVRLALLERTKEVLSQNRKGGPTSSSSTLPNVSVSAYKFKNARPLNKKDFEKAYAKLYASNAFQNDTSGEDSREQQQNMTAFDELISKMIQGMAEQNNNNNNKSSQNGKKGPEVDVEID